MDVTATPAAVGAETVAVRKKLVVRSVAMKLIVAVRAVKAHTRVVIVETFAPHLTFGDTLPDLMPGTWNNAGSIQSSHDSRN